MFKILNDPQATCARLAEAYIEAEAAEKSFKTEHDQAYEKLLDVQKDCFDSSKESKLLKDARAAYETAKLRRKACFHGLAQLKELMIKRLPVEATTRQKAIETEQKKLFSQKSALNEQYLSKIAEALVIQEQIEGRPMSDAGKGSWVERGIRNINLAVLTAEDRINLYEQVKTLRESLPTPEGGLSISMRLSRLWDESEKIKKMLCEPDPADGQGQLSVAEKIESGIERLIGSPA